MITVRVVHPRPGMDFTKAERFGALAPVFPADTDPFDLKAAAVRAKAVAEQADEDDWLLPCGYMPFNMLLAAAFYERFKRLRILIFHAAKQDYVAKEINGGLDGHLADVG